MNCSRWVNASGFTISTCLKDVDIETLHNFLSKESYWALNIPRKTVERGVKNSLNFSLISPENKFIGYTKVITDRATFAYIADVYVDKEFRGQGLGKWLMECIMNYHELKNLRLWLLHTKDAHDLYKKFGFSTPDNLEKMMHIYSPASACYGES